MKQYQQLLTDILNKGTKKLPARENLPYTISLFGTRIEHDMNDGFPLLTTKKMAWKLIVHELLWFLRGETNIKYLVDNNVHIWDQDAYRWYLKFAEDNGGIEQNSILKNNGDSTLSMFIYDEFVDKIKRTLLNDLPVYVFTEEYVQKHKGILSYKLGDLGKVYGEQWRNQNGVDQVQVCLNELKNNPMGRYPIIDAWNPADKKDQALPPCHLLYQFNCRELEAWKREDLYAVKYKFTTEQRYEMNPNASDEDVHKLMDEDNIPRYYLDLQMYQRSCDTFLGVPFNIASMSLLLEIFAKYLNYIPGKIIWIGGDTHIYEHHLQQVDEQLSRTPLKLPKIKINKSLYSIKDIEELTINDFELVDYVSHSSIKAELKTGL